MSAASLSATVAHPVPLPPFAVVVLFASDTVLEILSLAAAGTLQPVIHSRHPLERATAAFAALMAGCPTGKIVVTTTNKI